MSLSKSATSSAEPIYEHFITVCGICLSVYEVPKALIPCLHSFCLACIREWASHGAGSSHVVSCPTCRKECILPESGVEGLPTNFFITERHRVENTPTCNSCGKDNRDVVARCRECGFVCTECMASHMTMRMLKDHSVIMLDALRVGKAGKQLSMLRVSGEAHAKPRGGSFMLDKTIDMTSINFSIRRVWCSGVKSCDSKYEFTVPYSTFTSRAGVYIIGTDGKQKLIIDTKQGTPPGQYSQPWSVAMSSDGHFYITDSNPWVRVHNKEGQFMHLFQIHELNGSTCTSGSARGITIDNKGHIIVGNEINYTVDVYRPDESLIKAFKVNLRPYFVNVMPPNNSILISGISDDHVLEVDYSGKVLNKIQSPIANMTWQPRGVCCSNEEIYVVNSAKDQWCVCRFTSSWKFTGCIISDLKEPRGIAISEDEELLTVIDYGKELKIYRCM